MSYYDRWNDSNREAEKQGKRDAEYGYRSHRYDYDSYSERGNAYESGYREEQQAIERKEEERREEEREERRMAERQREREIQRRMEEDEYYLQQQYEEEQDRTETEPKETGSKDAK